MQGIKYNVDIVVCVDATGSMHGYIEGVKSGVLGFYNDLSSHMEEQKKAIDSLRVKIIPFRDYYDNPIDAMEESRFYQLPAEKEEFAAFVKTINASGGGDEPENGLEAIALAMKSDWTKTGDKRRQVVVVWTDASAHPLEKSKGGKPSTYPSDMPNDFSELTDLWSGQHAMSYSAQRLVMYAPDAHPWTDISNHWDNAIHYASKAGAGLADTDYSSILDAIARSI